MIFLILGWLLSESGFTGLKDKQDFDLLGGGGITNYELRITNNHPRVLPILKSRKSCSRQCLNLDLWDGLDWIEVKPGLKK